MTDVTEAARGADTNAKGGSKRRERRRKDFTQGDDGSRLNIPPEVLKAYPRERFVLRWFRNEEVRVKSKQAEDWDPVENVEPVPGATDRHGQPIDHILMVKHRDWYDADRAHLEVSRREIEKQALRGQVKGQGGGVGGDIDEGVRYTGNNRLS